MDIYHRLPQDIKNMETRKNLINHVCGCKTWDGKDGVYIVPCSGHVNKEVWIVLQHKDKVRGLKNGIPKDNKRA